MAPALPVGIYRIRNRITGEVYIGSTTSLYHRIKAHAAQLDKGCHGNRALQQAWKEYGRSSFAFSIVEITDASHEALEIAEQRWLDYYWGRLYNARLSVRRARQPKFYDRSRHQRRAGSGRGTPAAEEDG
jgi:group I intron endonuclease